jgi:hypothetical protein
LLVEKLISPRPWILPDGCEWRTIHRDKLGAEGGKVAIIEGLAAAPQSIARRDGAKSVFESAPNIELGNQPAGDWDRTIA